MHLSDSPALVIATIAAATLAVHVLIAWWAARRQAAWLRANRDIVADEVKDHAEPIRKLSEPNMNVASKVEKVAFSLVYS